MSISISSTSPALERHSPSLQAREAAKPASPPGEEGSKGLSSDSKGFSPEEEKELERLRERDAEVRRHEQAHQAVGGPHAGAPRYEYERGPDGRLYAVGGSVSIDLTPEADPRATLAKMERAVRAALAPEEPSGQDHRVAAEARALLAEARTEIRAENSGTEKKSEGVDAAAGRSTREGENQDAAGSPEARRAIEAYTRSPESENKTPSLNLVSCSQCGNMHAAGGGAA